MGNGYVTGMYNPYGFDKIGTTAMVIGGDWQFARTSELCYVNGWDNLHAAVNSLEELRCSYCNRVHARGKETCNGCGAPL
jgi:hypothetical protein